MCARDAFTRLFLTLLVSCGITEGTICAGFSSTCAVLDNGDMSCWGDASDGFTDSSPPSGSTPVSLPVVNLGAGKKGEKVACTGLHACALLDDGDVKCWGRGVLGVLGQGNEDPFNIFTDGEVPSVDLGLSGGVRVKDVCVLAGVSCVLLDNGDIKCWGGGQFGVLGKENSENIGHEPGEMGTSLGSVNLGTNTTAVQLACGGVHLCALLDNQKVKCWGGNVGIDISGTISDVGTLGFDSEIHAYGIDPGSMGDNLPFIDLGTDAKVAQIGAGYGFTCVLLESRDIKCWGDGQFGQLGKESSSSILGLAELGQMGDNLVSVDIGEGRNVVEISVGLASVCALLDTGRILCWENRNALGTGDTLGDIGDGPGEMGDNLLPVDLATGQIVSKVAAVFTHTCALLATQQLKCWGLSASDKLGYGTSVNYGEGFPGPMGDELPIVNLPGLIKMPETLFTFSPTESPTFSQSETLSKAPTLSPTGTPTSSPQVPLPAPTALPTITSASANSEQLPIILGSFGGACIALLLSRL